MNYIPPGTPASERRRQAILDSLRVLDTPAEQEFDGIARAAKLALNVETALLSLVDRERQWFKAAVGTTARQTPRDVSFCGHAILKPDEVMVVPDTREDERFRDNPLVTGDPRIRFYAGAPIVVSGEAVGTLCLLHPEPRPEGLSDRETTILRELSRVMSNALTARTQQIDYAQSVENQARELRHRVNNLIGLIDALAGRTATEVSNLPDFIELYRSRLQALARTQRLTLSTEDGTDIEQLIEAVVFPFRSSLKSRWSIGGRSIETGTRRAQVIALTVHELALNAFKYGAFSRPGGEVEVVLDGDPHEILITWKEIIPDGPVPESFAVDSALMSTGSGRSIVGRLVKAEGGTFDFDLGPRSLTAKLSLPA
ncbi:hypothetical protein B5C34_01405 [Pacificimonas flava]|uniref:histidine kinase n=2 Tax=Pacificimonas TaxID=1960290 RepID=A0A219B1L5_9SPHN|nr:MULTISPECIES: GAF domain-containing protein [Pacificimonas]MBZ6378127.1 GAF domain-containing protein [Pacificimonas aurantium]OWV32237.1 hypothetical protein B5C34_01405 [Pacificimonas flava]